MTEGIPFAGSPVGIPLEGAPIPFFRHEKKGCKVVCRIAELMCNRLGDDEKCKEKTEETKRGKIRMKDFLKFMREQYESSEVENEYIRAVTDVFEGKSEESARAVKSLPAIIQHPSGKTRVRNKTISLMPSHKRYVEAFGGGGSVLFNKEKSEEEVYNDKNSALTKFFECFRKISRDDIEKCNMSGGKEKFDEIRKSFDTDKECRDYVCDFLYLNKRSYGSQMQTYSRNVCHDGGKYCGTKSMTKDFEKLKDRLRDVKIENKDFRELIKKYDSDDTLFYLDPPYSPSKCLYGVGKPDKELCAVTPEEVKDALKSIKGRFILQYHDDPHVRELFKDYYIQPYTKPTSIPQKKRYNVKELHITNFKPNGS